MSRFVAAKRKLWRPREPEVQVEYQISFTYRRAGDVTQCYSLGCIIFVSEQRVVEYIITRLGGRMMQLKLLLKRTP